MTLKNKLSLTWCTKNILKRNHQKILIFRVKIFEQRNHKRAVFCQHGCLSIALSLFLFAGETRSLYLFTFPALVINSGLNRRPCWFLTTTPTQKVLPCIYNFITNNYTLLFSFQRICTLLFSVHAVCPFFKLHALTFSLSLFISLFYIFIYRLVTKLWNSWYWCTLNVTGAYGISL